MVDPASREMYEYFYPDWYFGEEDQDVAPIGKYSYEGDELDAAFE